MRSGFRRFVVDVSVLADHPLPAVVLVVGGILSVFIAIYGKHDDSYLDELATFGGFILGGVMIVMAVVVAYYESVTWFSLVMMVVVALTLSLKPLKDFPLAAVVGLAIGAIVTFVASIFIPSSVLGVEEWKILAVVFFVVAFFVWLILHFVEDVLKLAGKILDWRPTMVVVGVVAMVEGAVMLLDWSLASLF